MSVIGVNVYAGGRKIEEGIWDGGNPVKDAAIAVTVPGSPEPVLGKTPAGGYAEVPLLVPVGTEVEVAVTHAGETQRMKVKTSTSSGAAMAEFHFGSDFPILAVAIPAIVLGLLGYLYFSGK